MLLNAEVCEHHPPIIEEGNKRKWEWLGHGMTNSVSMLATGLTLGVGLALRDRDRPTVGNEDGSASPGTM